MKIYKIALLSFILLIIGCSKKEAPSFETPEDLIESDLIGDWQLIEFSDSEGNTGSSNAITFGLYCDAIVLKEDRTFAVYYQSSEVDESRNDGTWSLKESNLELIHGTSFAIPTEIIALESNFLTLRYSWLEGIIETVKLQRN